MLPVDITLLGACGPFHATFAIVVVVVAFFWGCFSCLEPLSMQEQLETRKNHQMLDIECRLW